MINLVKNGGLALVCSLLIDLISHYMPSGMKSLYQKGAIPIHILILIIFIVFIVKKFNIRIIYSRFSSVGRATDL